MKTKISAFIALLVLVSVVSLPVFSQDKTIISPYISFQYFKNSDDLRYLQTTLTYSKDRMELPLPGMEVSFYSGSDRKELLGTVLTNEKGIASYDLTTNSPLAKNSDGFWAFHTGFSGNDTIEAGNSELLIRDVKLEMTFSVVDTIKTISLTAFKSENNKDIPVSGEAVMVYVPRMFSLLPVGEALLDENGAASVEFPSDLPGDDKGNLTIISRFEEHPEFGNVELRAVQQWGVPYVNTAPVAHRALWTKTPPWWMIITLSVLLIGVWGHYLFAIISLIRIKKESKKDQKL